MKIGHWETGKAERANGERSPKGVSQKTSLPPLPRGAVSVCGNSAATVSTVAAFIIGVNYEKKAIACSDRGHQQRLREDHHGLRPAAGAGQQGGGRGLLQVRPGLHRPHVPQQHHRRQVPESGSLHAGRGHGPLPSAAQRRELPRVRGGGRHGLLRRGGHDHGGQLLRPGEGHGDPGHPGGERLRRGPLGAGHHLRLRGAVPRQRRGGRHPQRLLRDALSPAERTDFGSLPWRHPSAGLYAQNARLRSGEPTSGAGDGPGGHRPPRKAPAYGGAGGEEPGHPRHPGSGGRSRPAGI